MSHARSARPSAAPRSIMCASRGCVPSPAMRRPMAVACPRSSIASSRCSSSLACVSVAGGGGSSHASECGIAGTPAREFQRERREVGLENFRGGLRRQRRMRGLGPQSIAHARSRASCAAAALIGRRARNRHRLESTHAAAGIEALPPLETGIDDDAHALDGEARFGKIRRDDDFAAPRRRGPQRRVLRRGVEIAVQRQDLQRRVARPGRDGIATASDFCGARQEDEHVARVGLERAQDDASRALLDGFRPAVHADGRRRRVVRGRRRTPVPPIARSLHRRAPLRPRHRPASPT